jgi:hypothetical protein
MERLLKRFVKDFYTVANEQSIINNMVNHKSMNYLSKSELMNELNNLTKSHMLYQGSEMNSYLNRNYDISLYHKHGQRLANISASRDYVDVINHIIQMMNMSLDFNEILKISYEHDSFQTMAVCIDRGATLQYDQ